VILQPLQSQPLATEKQLQRLVEQNLHIFNLYLVKSELTLGDKRFDSFCVGDKCELAIIEYKKSRKDYQQSQIINYSEQIYKNYDALLNIIEDLYKSNKICLNTYKLSMKGISQISSSKSIRRICIAHDYDKFTLENDTDIERYRYYNYDFVFRLEKIPERENFIFSNVKREACKNCEVSDYLIELNYENKDDYNISDYSPRFITLDNTKYDCDNVLQTLLSNLDVSDIKKLETFSFIGNKEKLINPIAAGKTFIEKNLYTSDHIFYGFYFTKLLGKKLSITLKKIK
jgi:hypothetical protein